MGKRSAIVVVSSDDEDGDFSMGYKLSHSSAKSRPSSVPHPSNRRTKKTRLSDPSALSRTASNGFDELKLFYDDFKESFSGFKISTGSGRSNEKDLWVDKYRPHSLEELAVHKKKAEEVKVWLEGRLRKDKEEFPNNVLVITGQAGVGKSATVHAIASHLQATVYEWKTPTPTIWHEHLYNSNSGLCYTSKLDEFESFVERIRKYGLFPSSLNGGSQTSIILLIDDLPVANGKVAYERLSRCLHLLVQSAPIPTVILITECGKVESSDISSQSWEEIQLSLQKAGASKVAFNPITVNSIKKTLFRLCREEHCNLNAEQIDLIAKASGGDIRHAITSLQYFCVKPNLRVSPFSNGTDSSSKERSDELNHLDDRFSLPFGRDETISLFHALGKFLHNKREAQNSFSLEQDTFLVKKRFARPALKMEAPEKVLCKAYGQARPVADFLHENVLDFLSEEAIDDAWIVSSYLSDADFLLASLRGVLNRNYEAENVIQSSAASVAVRGVLYGNSHPLPSRWHAIRRPSLWQAEQSLRHNKVCF
ncbi:cell cycle checkpoint protein RAD17 isoform X2 [Diospyros lotus]|uniref:cell cycle checkpoint protein RAD17 isoform X2 n=1 Tax=Diospyros lotus TaxID=55363 RepID=UPI002252AD11|nr:cell cycle checkpoint protein RAD17 isoform X2 [Diospyros lotus]